jgi:hypothetical protein
LRETATIVSLAIAPPVGQVGWKEEEREKTQRAREKRPAKRHERPSDRNKARPSPTKVNNNATNNGGGNRILTAAAYLIIIIVDDAAALSFASPLRSSGKTSLVRSIYKKKRDNGVGARRRAVLQPAQEASF